MSAPEALEVSSNALSPPQAAEGNLIAPLTECRVRYLPEKLLLQATSCKTQQNKTQKLSQQFTPPGIQ